MYEYVIYILYNGTFVLDFCPAICSCPDPALESSLQRFPKFVLSQPSRGGKSWQVHSRTSAKRYPVHCFSRFWCPPEGLFLTTSLYDCWAHGFKKRPYVRVFASKILWHIIPCMVWLPTFFAILVVKKKVNLPYIWVTYSDLTMTWLESWFVRGTIPMPYFILFQVIG